MTRDTIGPVPGLKFVLCGIQEIPKHLLLGII